MFPNLPDESDNPSLFRELTRLLRRSIFISVYQMRTIHAGQFVESLHPGFLRWFSRLNLAGSETFILTVASKNVRKILILCIIGEFLWHVWHSGGTWCDKTFLFRSISGWRRKWHQSMEILLAWQGGSRRCEVRTETARWVIILGKSDGNSLSRMDFPQMRGLKHWRA